MKIQPKLAAALAALLIIPNTCPVYAADASRLPEAPASSQNNTVISASALPEERKTVTPGDPFPSSDDTPAEKPSAADTEMSGSTVPDEAPAFSAHIEYFHGQGYVVQGTFTEFLPDTSLVRPMYSHDGEAWQPCQATWNLQWLGSETAEELKSLQNQNCLYSTHEPLAGYLAGQWDHFYLKLQITLENGITYDTGTAVIDRGGPGPVPEGFQPQASFVPAMRIRQWRPFKSYGQYQLTVSADASPEDITALLPDTLPVDVQLYAGIDFVTNATVDCPVTWKPLSLSPLTPGESVTVADAAEEIIVPAGTLLNTPIGIYELNEPLGIDHDEIRLILNAVEENASPTGALACEIGGLQIAFHLKPTGATAIRAYTFSEGGTDWVELDEPLLPDEVNAPSSAASSTYTFILRNTSEPYHSYLTAWNAGEEPAPFYVGLKIEGGVYDGRQLILAWPDTCELPARLPDLKGSGGNECNAGADNKNDSTPEGQRPNLPQNPGDKPETQEPETPRNPQDEQDSQEPTPPQDIKDGQDSQEPTPPQDIKDGQDPQMPTPPQDIKDGQDSQEPTPPQDIKDGQDPQMPTPPQDIKDEQDSQEPSPPQDIKDEQDSQEPTPPQDIKDGQDSQMPISPQDAKDGMNAQEPERTPPLSDRQNAQKTDLSQLPEYKPGVQQPASYIPEIKPKRQSDLSRTPARPHPQQIPGEGPKDRQPEQHRPLEKETGGHTAGQENSAIRISLTGTIAAQTVCNGKMASADGENDSPAWERTDYGTESALNRLLFPAMAAIAVGVCIAAAVGKAMPGSMPGRLSRKIIHTLSRLLHLK